MFFASPQQLLRLLEVNEHRARRAIQCLAAKQAALAAARERAAADERTCRETLEVLQARLSHAAAALEGGAPTPALAAGRGPEQGQSPPEPGEGGGLPGLAAACRRLGLQFSAVDCLASAHGLEVRLGRLERAVVTVLAHEMFPSWGVQCMGGGMGGASTPRTGPAVKPPSIRARITPQELLHSAGEQVAATIGWEAAGRSELRCASQRRKEERKEKLKAAGAAHVSVH